VTITERARQATRPDRGPCGFYVWWDGLRPDIKGEVSEAVGATDISSSALHGVIHDLPDNPYPGSLTTLREHRGGRCSCQR
jgi:hypothetical protein